MAQENEGPTGTEKETLKKNPSDAKRRGRASVIIYWASINAIIINIVIFLIYASCRSIITTQDNSVDTANKILVQMGVSLGVLCSVLWVGHVTSINKVESLLAKALWATFVLSLLVTSVSAYRMKMFNTKYLEISFVNLPDETQIREEENRRYLADLKLKSNNRFTSTPSPRKGRAVKIPILFPVTGYKKDESGHYSVGAFVTLVGRDEISSVGPTLTEGAPWTDQPIVQSLPNELREELKAKNNDRILFVVIFEFDADPGFLETVRTLRTTVTDRISRLSTTYEIPITVE